MSFLGLYKIKGCNGKIHYKTAKQLYEQILNDSKSNHELIATASELVRICEEPDFPKNYAEEIKICILKSYASLERNKKNLTEYLQENDVAIRKCYNSMSYSTDEDAISARKGFFSEILNSIIKNNKYSIRLKTLYGSTYYKVCDDWKKSMFEQHFSEEPIKSLERLKSELQIELHNTLKTAEIKGVFIKKDEKAKSEYKLVNNSKKNYIEQEELEK